MTEAKGINTVKSLAAYYQIASHMVKPLAPPAEIDEEPVSASSQAISISIFLILI